MPLIIILMFAYFIAEGPSMDEVAKVIDSSAAVVVGMSNKYQLSPSCRIGRHQYSIILNHILILTYFINTVFIIINKYSHTQDLNWHIYRNKKATFSLAAFLVF